MRPAAEADLEMQGAVVAEQAGGGDLSLLRDGEGGEQGVDQLLLPLAELVPGLAAVEAVERGGIAGFMRCHARADRAFSRRVKSPAGTTMRDGREGGRGRGGASCPRCGGDGAGGIGRGPGGER